MHSFFNTLYIRKGLALALVLALSICAVPATATASALAAGANTPSAWAAEAVDAAKKAGFVPDNLQSAYTQPITRVEFSALIVKFYEAVKGEEIKGRAIFDDTNDVNAQKAGYIGVMQGTGEGMFQPNSRLNRQQAATVLARLGGEIGKPMPATYYYNTPYHNDYMDIAEWAFTAVAQLTQINIMRGVGADRFAPLEYYTREQSIVTLMRLYQDYDVIYSDDYVVAFIRDGVLNVTGATGNHAHGETIPDDWDEWEYYGRWHYTEHGAFILGSYKGDSQWYPSYRYKDGVFEECPELYMGGVVSAKIEGDYLYATYYRHIIGNWWNTTDGSNLYQTSLKDFSERKLGEAYFVYGFTDKNGSVDRTWEVRADGVYIHGLWQVPDPNPDNIEDREESGYYLVDLEGKGHKKVD